MHISSVIKISFCRISFSGHQNKFCACLDSIYGSRVILVMCKNCSDIRWHRLNSNQSKTNCPKNLNSDGLIVREMGPWPEGIFRSLLQFLVMLSAWINKTSVLVASYTIIHTPFRNYICKIKTVITNKTTPYGGSKSRVLNMLFFFCFFFIYFFLFMKWGILFPSIDLGLNFTWDYDVRWVHISLFGRLTATCLQSFEEIDMIWHFKAIGHLFVIDLLLLIAATNHNSGCTCHFKDVSGCGIAVMCGNTLWRIVYGY